MKKGWKVAIGIIGAAGIAGGCYWQYKKELAKQEAAKKKMIEQEKELAKEAEKIGINKEKFDKELSVNGCFLKAIYTGLRFNPRFDIDLFNVEKGIVSDNTIAINLGMRDGTTEIQCRIKNSTDRYSPTAPDYIRALGKTIQGLREKGFNFNVNRNLTAYLRFWEEGKNEIDVEKAIPRWVYSDWADEQHDGVLEFYQDFKNGDDSAIQAISKWLEQEGVTGVVHDTFMSLACTLVIEDKIGINPTLDLIEAILNTDISRNDRGAVNYQYIVVYGPDEEGYVDINHCYDTDDSGKVVVVEC